MASKRSDAQQNRQHLVDVARSMARSGEVPSFNALAKAAKVGVGTVYRHFADEAALVAALAEAPLDDFAKLIDTAVADDDAMRALTALFHGCVELVMHKPLVAKLLIDAPTSAKPLEKKIGTVVERAKKAKQLRPDVTMGDFRRLVCGIQVAAMAGEKPREAAARYVDIVLLGLRSPAVSTRGG